MMTLNEWKQLGGLAILIFSAMLITMYIFGTILEIRKKKCRRKQVTHKYAKIDLYEYLVANIKQEYIGQGKVIRNELARVLG